MQNRADEVLSYIASLPADRREAVSILCDTIRMQIPEGYREVMSYGMIGYVVPHDVYPAGYHADPRLPLPFMSVASQKRHVALYHMGLYAMPALTDWFLGEFAKRVGGKPDMGKSCIRFANPMKIPLDLVGELAGKVRPEEWIRVYEHSLKR